MDSGASSSAASSLRAAINQPPELNRERSGSLHSKFFPCNALGLCCPCLPTSLKHVKDWLHLVLILGTIASFACVVLQIVEITNSDEPCHSALCVRQWIVAVVLLPSMWDFIKFIGTYDESLQAHQERAEEEVSHLIQEINGQVSEMQDICGKLTASADDFASRTFNDKRERFESFIMDIGRFYDDLYQDEEIVEQLRVFVVKWFLTYSQSLLDQMENASVKGVQEEFAKCRTVKEICEKATRRLSMLKMSMRIVLFPAQSFVLQQPGQASIADGSLDEEGMAGDHALQVEGRSVRRSPRKIGVSWLRLGRSGFGRQGPRTRDGARVVQGWPLTIGFSCGSITVLSRRHLNHLLYLVVDLSLIGWELAFHSMFTIVLVVSNGICVLSTLACFEQIDDIAKLQQRISNYQEKSEKVKEEFKKATDNWEKVQQLHDLWNYRSMPFLSIMGKIHNQLDRMDRNLCHKAGGDDNRLEWLKLANQSLEALDQKLGPASNWTRVGEAPLDDQWKATVGRQLRDAEHFDNVDKLIEALPLLTNPMLSQLKNGPMASEDAHLRPPTGSMPSSSSQPVPRGSPRIPGR